MAKRKDPTTGLSDIFTDHPLRRTEPADSSQPDKPVKRKRGRPKKRDTISPVGVTLSQDDLNRLDAIAEEIGFSRNALLTFAVRSFLKRWDEGERPKTKTKTIEILDV